MTRCSPLKKGPEQQNGEIGTGMYCTYSKYTYQNYLYTNPKQKHSSFIETKSPKQHTVIKDVRMKIDVMPIHASSL